MMPDTSFATQKTGLNSTVNFQPAVHAKAVRLWNEGEAKRFEFCEEAAGVVGNYDKGKTKSLADGIFRSVTRVQDLAKVGKLWLEIVKVYPSDAELLRDELQVGFWEPVARLYAQGQITLAGAYMWLKVCRTRKKTEQGFTVERFRSGLPSVDGTVVLEYEATMKQLQFRADSFMATLEEAMTAPSLGADPKEYKKLQRALRLVKGRAARVMRKAEEL